MRAAPILSVCLWILGASTSVSAQSSDRTVKIHAWPLDAASPKQLAEVSYNPVSLTSSVIRFTKPDGPQQSEDLVRVGIYDAETTDWRGVVTSSASFDKQYQQKLSLHIDEAGDVWHVGIAAQPFPKSKGAKKGINQNSGPVEQLVVEIVKPTRGPTPVLNKPIVLNPEGKVQEKEPEKSFLQKYWWIIAIFIGMQVFTAGGAAGDKK